MKSLIAIAGGFSVTNIPPEFVENPEDISENETELLGGTSITNASA